MKRNRLFPAICLAAALLLSACSQDEPTENSTALPEGEYPLQIGSVTLTAEVSEQPWTRVSENLTDGMSSVWADGDRIGVRIGDNEETGIYVVNVDETTGNITVTPEKAVYWKDKQPATITAWYPVEKEIDFTQQDEGLTYLLKADGVEADYDTPANLTFAHQLAKVRVKLEGAKANEVTAVTVRSYPKATHNQGTYVTKEGDAAYYPMREATYDGETYWEANLLDGHLEAANTFRVSKDGKNFVQVKLTKDVNIDPGYVHTININVGEAQQVEGNISDNGTYIVSGTREEPVNITGGNPTIYLENANISVNNGDAISITGDANATIHITGNNTVQNTSYTINGAGIYVEAGSTVTIEGTNRNTDVLTAIAANDAAGIGGNSNGQDCGNIHIHNVTVVAKGDQSIALSPGIGSTGNNNCGQIIIDNATVHAYGQGISGTAVCPAIGPGFSSGLEYGNLPMVTIRNESEVHAHRGGGNADYIGYPYKYSVATGAASTVNLGQGGTCTSSTIYCYTGESTDKEHIYFYDNQGNRTEQSQ